MGSIKKKREGQFWDFSSGVASGISGALISCAFDELFAARDDRLVDKKKQHDNHYSVHALGSIVLLVTALDSYLNEIIWQMCPTGKDEYNVRELIGLNAAQKYKEILKRKADKEMINKDIPKITDLKIVVDLRDEIVHFLPRVVPRNGSKKNVPEWFDRLVKLGLLLDRPIVNDETPLGRNLMSYKLAYWSWEVVTKAMIDFAEAFKPDTHQIIFDNSSDKISVDFSRFLLFKNIEADYSPENLQI
jgi:hypothetical protein